MKQWTSFWNLVVLFNNRQCKQIHWSFLSPTPRGSLRGLARGGLQAHPQGRGLQAHTQGRSPGHTQGWSPGPPPSRWLLLRAVRILLDCILVLQVSSKIMSFEMSLNQYYELNQSAVSKVYGFLVIFVRRDWKDEWSKTGLKYSVFHCFSSRCDRNCVAYEWHNCFNRSGWENFIQLSFDDLYTTVCTQAAMLKLSCVTYSPQR